MTAKVKTNAERVAEWRKDEPPLTADQRAEVVRILARRSGGAG